MLHEPRAKRENAQTESRNLSTPTRFTRLAASNAASPYLSAKWVVCITTPLPDGTCEPLIAGLLRGKRMADAEVVT